MFTARDPLRPRTRDGNAEKAGSADASDAARLSMDRGGLEPPTSRLSGVRSNHLSYRSVEPKNLTLPYGWLKTGDPVPSILVDEPTNVPRTGFLRTP